MAAALTGGRRLLIPLVVAEGCPNGSARPVPRISTFERVPITGLALALLIGVAPAFAQTPRERAGEHQLAVEDPGCIPGECICRGRVDLRARLNETGPGPEELAVGVRCVVADYDGNGANDYALGGAEGTATVILSKSDGGFLKAIRLDAGGLMRLYRPRPKPGPHGEPASLLPGLFVPWVGQEHVVFLWTGEGFARTRFPAKPR